MSDKKKIMYESDEAATYKTVKGWVSSDGRFFGESEELARWSGCTHKPCACGGETEKMYNICRKCRDKASTEKYLSMDYQEYRGQPVWSKACGEYFFDEDRIRDWAEWNEVENIDDLQLIICEPEYIEPFDWEHLFEDIMPDDMCLYDVAPKIAQKFEELNRFIKSENTIASWFAGNKRTSLPPTNTDKE